MGRTGPPDWWNWLTRHDLEGKQGIRLEVLAQPKSRRVHRVMAGAWKKKDWCVYSTVEYVIWCLMGLMAPIYFLEQKSFNENWSDLCSSHLDNEKTRETATDTSIANCEVPRHGFHHTAGHGYISGTCNETFIGKTDINFQKPYISREHNGNKSKIETRS